MSIKLITFDLDNTLWENDSVILRAERACYHFLAERSPQLANTFTLGELMKQRLHLLEEQPQLISQISQLRIAAMEKALRAIEHPPQEINQLAQLAFEHFMQERNRVELYPHATQTLANLQQQFTLASLTNGNSNLQIIGLQDYFDFSLSAEQVGASKPQPDMFLAALEKAGVAPQHTLHIGDHPHDDIHGAQQLGIHTLWFNPQNKPWNEESAADTPSLEARCLSELPQKVQQLCEQLG